jgi:ribonucleoside-diphosphate reductase alpha chain
MTTPFTEAISRQVWDSKYRYRDGEEVRDRVPADTWRRVARAAASVESEDRQGWEERFFQILEQRLFLPGGRILAGAGTRHQVTLFNCFAMGIIEDSLEGILDALKEGALTMQEGGGVGYDFSTLRPAGSAAHRVGGVASGPVSFMRVWDSLCATLLSTASRRGAMMATLRIDHPDVETFIDAKRQAGELRNFNLSVLVSDAFMAALEQDADWPLVFPAGAETGGAEILVRDWPGHPAPVPCRVYRRVRARDLWQRLMQATYACAEPGVLFIDRVNRDNNLWYRERIYTTNPCGEIPLPPYGACNLGSLNLAVFVMDPFTPKARWDLEGLTATAAVAVRLLDNVVDISLYPLEAQRQQARSTRRLGLGITGLADALVMWGLHYGEAAARHAASAAMAGVRDAAYRTSVALAAEKGPCPAFVRDSYLAGPFIRSLPESLRDGIAEQGIRNSHLLAIAPAGSISLLADNVSNGLEPVFAPSYHRRVLTPEGYRDYVLTPYSLRYWQRLGREGLPPAFVTAEQIPPQSHLAMQAALQRHVDNAISKTIHVPADFPFADFQSLYQDAYRLGLKGCTTYRPSELRGTVLRADTVPELPSCCPECAPCA